jgi:Ca2+-dependent lipid-binding protein
MSRSFVTINFKEGRSLVAKDSNGASDPYVKAFVPGTYPVTKSLSTVKSKVIKANLNPKWNFIVNAFQGVTADALASLPAVKVF